MSHEGYLVDQGVGLKDSLCSKLLAIGLVLEFLQLADKGVAEDHSSMSVGFEVHPDVELDGHMVDVFHSSFGSAHLHALLFHEDCRPTVGVRGLHSTEFDAVEPELLYFAAQEVGVPGQQHPAAERIIRSFSRR